MEQMEWKDCFLKTKVYISLKIIILNTLEVWKLEAAEKHKQNHISYYTKFLEFP